MALSRNNRKWVVGGLLVGAIGGGELVLSLIDFGGSAAGTGLEQVPKLEQPAVAGVGSLSRLGGAAIDGLSPIQDSMDRLSATTVAPAAAPLVDPDR